MPVVQWSTNSIHHNAELIKIKAVDIAEAETDAELEDGEVVGLVIAAEELLGLLLSIDLVRMEGNRHGMD